MYGGWTLVLTRCFTMDEAGYLVTRGGRDGMATATSIAGVFAAGDVQDFFGAPI